MPMRTVLGFVAYVADTGQGRPTIIKRAQGKVYSVNDVGLTTPLACRDIATESVIPNPVSNEDGFIDPFKVSISDTASGVLWVSGGYPIYQPFLGVKGEKGNKGDTGGISEADMETAATAAKNAAIQDATTKYGPLLARLTKLDGQGQRGYTIGQTAGRTVKVWDYLNNREQLIYGDTGWRNISSLVPTGITTTTLYMKRAGNSIHLVCQGISSATAGNITFITLPSGFKGDSLSLRAGVAADRNGTSSLQISPYNGGVRILGMDSGTTYEFGCSFTTSDPWPTTLPGVA